MNFSPKVFCQGIDPYEDERVEANKARANKCFSDIAKMKRNNKVLKKKLIEYSM